MMAIWPLVHQLPDVPEHLSFDNWYINNRWSTLFRMSSLLLGKLHTSFRDLLSLIIETSIIIILGKISVFRSANSCSPSGLRIYLKSTFSVKHFPPS